MHDDDDVVGNAIELLVDYSRYEQDTQRELAERAQDARLQADAARLALASLAEDAVRVIAFRLHASPAEGGQGALKAGEFPMDASGRPVTKEREATAWEILSRIGIPKLKATSIAASIAAHTGTPAPLSPGWEPPEIETDNDEKAIDISSVDSQIEAFLAGADAAEKMKAKRKNGEAA